MNNFLQH